MTRTKRRNVLFFSVIIAVILSICVITPAFAEVSSSELRHSVVFVEFGLEGDEGYWPVSSGSGFFIGRTGEDPQTILTNHHVVEDFINFGSGVKQGMDFSTFAEWVSQTWFGASLGGLGEKDQEYCISIAAEQWVKFMGNREEGYYKSKLRIYYDTDDYEEGYLVDSDPIRDMAILRLASPTNKRTPLKIMIPNEEMVSGNVYVVGYPGIADNEFFEAVNEHGENDATVTEGTVSKLFKETGTGRAVIQTDTVIAHGNSGGPMIFENGAAIGINSWTVKNNNTMEQVYYALSMEDVVPILEDKDIEYEMVQTSESGGKKRLFLFAGGAAVIAVLGAGAVLKSALIKKTDDSGFRIQCIRGTLGNKRVMIPGKEKVRMGRATDNGIVFPENTKGVSKYHCTIWYENGHIYIQDLGSTYGTFVEPGDRLNPNQSVPLSVGQKFWLADQKECFMIQKKNR